MTDNSAKRAGVRYARPLTGLSGAEVFLASQDGRRWFVRKIAGNATTLSTRLRVQADKQRRFGALKLGLTVPAILNEGMLEDRYYFDMEYVRGVDGATFLRNASRPEIEQFARKLSEYLRAAQEQEPLCATTTSLFAASYDRIVQVQQKTGLLSADCLGRLLVALRPLLSADLPPTLCHGDLTLENLVVQTDGTICALDLNETPYEHYWQDLAKLHQDLAGGWYRRRLADEIPPYVLDFVRQRLRATARALDARYDAVHAVMTAIVFARILPYVHSDDERRFVLERVNYFAAQAERATI